MDNYVASGRILCATQTKRDYSRMNIFYFCEWICTYKYIYRMVENLLHYVKNSHTQNEREIIYVCLYLYGKSMCNNNFVVYQNKKKLNKKNAFMFFDYNRRGKCMHDQ